MKRGKTNDVGNTGMKKALGFLFSYGIYEQMHKNLYGNSSPDKGRFDVDTNEGPKRISLAYNSEKQDCRLGYKTPTHLYQLRVKEGEEVMLVVQSFATTSSGKSEPSLKVLLNEYFEDGCDAQDDEILLFKMLYGNYVPHLISLVNALSGWLTQHKERSEGNALPTRGWW